MLYLFYLFIYIHTHKYLWYTSTYSLKSSNNNDDNNNNLGSIQRIHTVVFIILYNKVRQ